MTASLHPMPAYEASRRETRRYKGAKGQLEEVTLKLFYWTHFDWYLANGYLESYGSLDAFFSEADKDRGSATIEDCARYFIDQWMIPSCIMAGIPPFGEIPLEERLKVIAESDFVKG